MKSLATGISFGLPRLKCIPRHFEKYIHGEWIDRNPLSVDAEIQDDSLFISYDYKESLRIIIPWEIEGLGVFFLKTVTLPKRDKPYDLALELARGTVGRLVDQTENWKAGGLILPEEIDDQIGLVKKNFRRATFCSGDERFQYASVAIGASIHLMNEVGSRFAKYVFDFRRHEKQPNTGLLGAPYYSSTSSDVPLFQSVFNTAVVNPEFISLESDELNSKSDFCERLQRQGITTCGGPVIRFNDFRSSAFESIDDAECWMIEKFSRSYDQGFSHCKLLMPISGLGHCSEASWNDQEQIHLTYELTSWLKEKAPHIPQIIGIDQPFGESQIIRNCKSPLQLADNLIRMEAPISAFCLELNLGYYPEGTWIRDLFAFNDLLDSWGQFDHPLILQLRIPGGVRTIDDEEGDQFVAAGFDSQASWLEKIAMLALAKQNVAGVFYAQVFDHPEDQYFGAGLISTQETAKPAMDSIKKVRQSMA